jgi:hypothetical protein
LGEEDQLKYLKYAGFGKTAFSRAFNFNYNKFGDYKTPLAGEIADLNNLKLKIDILDLLAAEEDNETLTTTSMGVINFFE